jgi:hypothetical protein
MQRFRRFLHTSVSEDRLHDGEGLSSRGVRGRWVPDPIEAFDEVELAIPLDEERDLVVTMALEDGRLERMMLAWAPAGDDDADARALDEEGIARALEARGEGLVELLEHLTGS